MSATVILLVMDKVVHMLNRRMSGLYQGCILKSCHSAGLLLQGALLSAVQYVNFRATQTVSPHTNADDKSVADKIFFAFVVLIPHSSNNSLFPFAHSSFPNPRS